MAIVQPCQSQFHYDNRIDITTMYISGLLNYYSVPITITSYI